MFLQSQLHIHPFSTDLTLLLLWLISERRVAKKCLNDRTILLFVFQQVDCELFDQIEVEILHAHLSRVVFLHKTSRSRHQ